MSFTVNASNFPMPLPVQAILTTSRKVLLPPRPVPLMPARAWKCLEELYTMTNRLQYGLAQRFCHISDFYQNLGSEILQPEMGR
jgi:hypothetical protein